MPAPQMVRLTSNRRYFRELGTAEIDGEKHLFVLGDKADKGTSREKTTMPVLTLPIDVVRQLKKKMGAKHWDACTQGEDPEFLVEVVGSAPKL